MARLHSFLSLEAIPGERQRCLRGAPAAAWGCLGAGVYWSVQPPPEGPQQRLAGNAEQFVTEEASLV